MVGGCCRVRVTACALNPKDVLVRKGSMRWLTGDRFPRIPGYDLAGTLLTDADDLPAGTKVYGMVDSHQGGACAEEVVLPFSQVARAPKRLSLLDAAALPLAGLTAMQALRDHLQLRRGQRILINGASGGVGTLAVQLAKAHGAHVTGVCSGRNSERVQSLGADAVIDYTTTDLSELRGFDAVFDVFGSLPWPEARPLLTKSGRYCTTIVRTAVLARGALATLGLHRAHFVHVRSTREDLDQLRELVAARKVQPVIDRILPLGQARAGHAFIETKRARGKVVIRLSE
jgi:NADPH:quinone reductase-like Zn-dependent oxidoreductase